MSSSLASLSIEEPQDAGTRDRALSPPVAPPTPRWITAASWALVAAGLAMQLYVYLGGRILWLDEAMVALNIRYLSVHELTGRLEYDQIAPVGWLLLEKLASAAPLPMEYSLRLPALIAGMAGLLLFRPLAFRVLGGFGALAAVTLYAMSPVLVRYAAEVKPYGVDALLTVALLWIAADLLDRRFSAPRLALLFAVGVAGVTVSFPVVYILATVGGVLALHRLMHRRWGEVVALTAIGLCWLALFGILYLRIYHPQVAGTTLTDGANADFFNKSAYAPLPPRSLRDIAWYAQWIHQGIRFFFGSDSRFAIALAGSAGLVCLIGRRSWLAPLICAPVVLALIGSAAHAYPLFDRLLLFLAAPNMLLLGAGIGWLAGRTRAPLAIGGLLLAFCVAGGMPYLQGSLRASPPFSFNNLTPIFEALRRERAPGDIVYVSNQAIPAYLLYRSRYGLSDLPWVAGKAQEPSWQCMSQEFLARRSQGRVWVLMLTVGNRQALPPTTLELALSARNLDGELRQAASGWNAWLYELNLKPRDAALLSPTAIPDIECGADGPGKHFDAPARLLARVP